MASKKSLVINHSDTDYVETFHGKRYMVPANGSIELSRHEAIEFVGNYAGDNVKKPLKIQHLAVGKDEISTGYQCNLCPATFGTAKALEKHIEDAHGNDERTQKVYACPFCDFKCRSRKELLAHIKTHKEQSVDSLIDALE